MQPSGISIFLIAEGTPQFHIGYDFVRCADDVLVFTKSEAAANRVMTSISSWIERKLFLKVNATKSKVVRPMRSKYLDSRS